MPINKLAMIAIQVSTIFAIFARECWASGKKKENNAGRTNRFPSLGLGAITVPLNGLAKMVQI